MNILEDSSTGEVPQTNLPTDSSYKPSTKHAHTQIQLYEGSGKSPEGETMLEKRDPNWVRSSFIQFESW